MALLGVLQGVEGQPGDIVVLVESWMWWVIGVLLCLGLGLVSWMYWNQAQEDVQAPMAVPEGSQAQEDVQASVAVPEGSQAQEDVQASIAVPEGSQAPEDMQFPVAESAEAGGLQEVEETREHCEFPLVGRVQAGCNWVPTHYLRRLLSVVGDGVLGCLGLSAVEIWRLRAVGRSFRYGVAFAYEKALGQGPLPRRGGAGTVYDIADAALLLTPDGVQPAPLPVMEAQGSEDFANSLSSSPGNSEPSELSSRSSEDYADDPAIDEVRHIPPPEGVGLRGGGLGVLAGNWIDPPSSDSGHSTTMSAAWGEPIP